MKNRVTNVILVCLVAGFIIKCSDAATVVTPADNPDSAVGAELVVTFDPADVAQTVTVNHIRGSNTTKLADVTVTDSTGAISSTSQNVAGYTVAVSSDTLTLTVTIAASEVTLDSNGDKIQWLSDAAGNAEDDDYTITIPNCQPHVASAVSVKSSTGGTTDNKCTTDNYRFQTCTTVFQCADGYLGSHEVTSKCTNETTPKWKTTLPTSDDCKQNVFGMVTTNPTEYTNGTEVTFTVPHAYVEGKVITAKYNDTVMNNVTITASSATVGNAADTKCGVVTATGTSITIKVKMTFDCCRASYTLKEAADSNTTLTISPNCNCPITSDVYDSSKINVKSSSGTGCNTTNYNMNGCSTVFECKEDTTKTLTGKCVKGWWEAEISKTCSGTLFKSSSFLMIIMVAFNKFIV